MLRMHPRAPVPREPALLSGLLFLTWFPLILERSSGLYRSVTGVEPPDYLARRLLLRAALFAASLVVGLLRAARQPRGRA
jgi:hypothetical protein